MSKLFLSRTQPLVGIGVSTRPPYTSTPQPQVLLQGVDPTPIGIDIDFRRGMPMASVWEGKVRWLLVCLDFLETLPCIVRCRIEAMLFEDIFNFLVLA